MENIKLAFYNKKGGRLEKITWFDSGKIFQGMALIGKNGQFRFKKEFAAAMGFENNQRWMVGVNSEKTILYFIKPKQGEEANGFKMCYQNKSWFMAAKTVINELKLVTPLRGVVEKYKDVTMEGFIMKLPKEALAKTNTNGNIAEQ